MAKPGIPQGTRDFTADTIRKRNHIFSTIKNIFELYGFQPLETPAFENIETLMGKYGEEGDKLIFKILNNGLSDPKNIDKAKEGFEKMLDGKNSSLLTERALKYDLTIPFARFVAMNHGQLVFPYKRYQIQPVWRADRPQKGRYREFTQCDADIVGSNALLNEIELANIYHQVFTLLGIKSYRLNINNRKILLALAETCGGVDKLIDITVSIDKLDKIGIEKVKEELQQRGLNEVQIATIEKYLSISGSNEEKITAVASILGGNPQAAEGINELTHILAQIKNVQACIDFTLARGLNYYTGTIFEVKAPDSVKMGSIGGGGRYDNLTGLFGVPGIPGVGISFGVDRIYDVMEELQLFSNELITSTKILFFNLGEKESMAAFKIMQTLRADAVSCELYYENSKIDKQFKYAEKKNIPYVIFIGQNEMDKGTCTIKELSTGKQETILVADIKRYLKQIG